MNISVVYDNSLYLTDIVQEITWSGDVNLAYRSLVITLVNTLNGKEPEITFELGKEIRFLSEDMELFRGFIFRTSIDQGGMMSLTVYDANVYLVKNEDTRKFTNMTASQIVRSLCNDFGIAYGTIEDTGYVIPKLVLRDMTLWNMMVTALTVTLKQTGRRYYIYADKGALHLVARKKRVAKYVIESATNLTSASYAQSIEDLRNQVRVIGGDDKKPLTSTVKDAASITRFGIMQHLENADSDATAAQVKQLAEQRLKELNVIDDEATITALGFDDVKSGVCTYVYDKMTGILGGYYVSTDTHTFSNGMHTMSLTLSATDDLPTLEYTPPVEVKVKEKKKTKPKTAETRRTDLNGWKPGDADNFLD